MAKDPGRIPGYKKTVREYHEEKNKIINEKDLLDHGNITIAEFLVFQMDSYLNEVIGDEYEEQIVGTGEKSTSYKYVLKVDLPTMEGFCDEYDYPCTTIDDRRRENDNISATFKRLFKKQARMLQSGAISGRYNPIIAKMLLNVNHGYKEVDTKKVEHSGAVGVLSKKEIEEMNPKACDDYLSNIINGD